MGGAPFDVWPSLIEKGGEERKFPRTFTVALFFIFWTFWTFWTFWVIIFFEDLEFLVDFSFTVFRVILPYRAVHTKSIGIVL